MISGVEVDLEAAFTARYWGAMIKHRRVFSRGGGGGGGLGLGFNREGFAVRAERRFSTLARVLLVRCA